jgi:hypothetical protein
LQTNNVVFDGALTGVLNRSGGGEQLLRSSTGDSGGTCCHGRAFVISETRFATTGLVAPSVPNGNPELAIGSGEQEVTAQYKVGLEQSWASRFGHSPLSWRFACRTSCSRAGRRQVLPRSRGQPHSLWRKTAPRSLAAQGKLEEAIEQKKGKKGAHTRTQLGPQHAYVAYVLDDLAT